jgi:hypothetical protein
MNVHCVRFSGRKTVPVPNGPAGFCLCRTGRRRGSPATPAVLWAESQPRSNSRVLMMGNAPSAISTLEMGLYIIDEITL